MSRRDWFMQNLGKEQAKLAPEKDHQGPILTEAARFSLLLDGIKLIGTGNGAGAFASVAALYYFASRPELHLPIKIAAIFFVVGLVIFVVVVGAYVRLPRLERPLVAVWIYDLGIGYLIITPERFMSIITAEGRKPPQTRRRSDQRLPIHVRLYRPASG